MNTREKIIKFIERNKQATANALAEYLGISRQALYKHLSDLQEKEIIFRTGRPPKVFYSIKMSESKKDAIGIDPSLQKIIEEDYMIITPSGERLPGLAGFEYWCDKQSLPLEKTAREYVNTLKKYQAFKKNDFADGMGKMKTTFKKVWLDQTIYLDFYSIERFGKTKLGQLLLYAKQSQNKKLIMELIDFIRPKVEKIVEQYKIDGVGFVPPTVKRDVQLMNVLRKRLELKLKRIDIAKLKTEIIVPQKTLNKLNDRIENAQRTFALEESGRFKNILLIDDAVGSGATLNEIARKIKEKGIAKKVIGLTITGSFKGFDVISEV
jgi:phosphoribosylpyrophosphate synthetase